MSDITIYYWPIRFRGNFLKYILEEAGHKYATVSTYPEIKKALDDAKDGYPVFAVPLLKVGSFRCSQMPAAVLHLAKMFHMEPSDGNDKTLALMMLLNCNDILDSITMNGGHYMMWTPEKWKTFQDGRLAKWLGVLDTALGKNPKNAKAEKIYFFGVKPTYVDFGVLAILDGLVDEFGLVEYVGKFPLLSRFFKEMSARPSVQKLWSVQKPKDRSKWAPWCGGQIQKSIETSIAEPKKL
uniref:Glutathione S-transferase n=1 Tax=Lotharella oceanica TaxID=641309 RepID=A0A7S2TQD9_9EUKA